MQKSSRRRLLTGAIVAGLLLAAYVFHPLYLSALGRALIVDDPLEKADAILVLAGDTRRGDRVSHAVRLFHDGYAPVLVLSGTPMGWQTHAVDVGRRQAIHLGVPETQILAMPQDTDSTKEEAAVIVPLLQAKGFRTVILVSSSWHTARAKHTFERKAGAQGPRFLASPVQDGLFEPDGWWTRRRDAKTFFYEAIRTVWSWVEE